MALWIIVTASCRVISPCGGCGQIGKQVGFSWGGDWKKFPDKPHFQWDDHLKYTGSMILAGKYPPEMEEYMDQANVGLVAVFAA